SACFKANAICCSVNLDFLMAKYLLIYCIILPDFSTFTWFSLQGEGQKIFMKNMEYSIQSIK
ncbi:MAG TPA: hypothetical protein VLB82_09315, partial [Thermodesulfobacteriota bacterium]|nr:hypothetical protein [Thermodesulfobacteriota bacterium]